MTDISLVRRGAYSISLLLDWSRGESKVLRWTPRTPPLRAVGLNSINERSGVDNLPDIRIVVQPCKHLSLRGWCKWHWVVEVRSYRGLWIPTNSFYPLQGWRRTEEAALLASRAAAADYCASVVKKNAKDATHNAETTIERVTCSRS